MRIEDLVVAAKKVVEEVAFKRQPTATEVMAKRVCEAYLAEHAQEQGNTAEPEG